jgi:hypothetical protein
MIYQISNPLLAFLNVNLQKHSMASQIPEAVPTTDWTILNCAHSTLCILKTAMMQGNRLAAHAVVGQICCGPSTLIR